MKKYIDLYKDKNNTLRYVALSFAFVLVILLGFGAKFYLQSDFDSVDFWGDFALSACLCIYCLFIGMPEAKETYKKKEGGRYQTAMSAFKSIRDIAMPKDKEFDEFLEKFYEEQKLDYHKQLLTVSGVTEFKVLELDVSELKNLKEPWSKEWDDGTTTEFRTHSDEQIALIKKIITGKVKVRKIPNDAFKTANGKVIANEYVTQSKQETRDSLTYIGLIASRLFLMMVISFLLVIFGIELAQAGDKQKLLNQLIDTISRLWTMMSSYMYGYSIGKMMVGNECNRIEFKTRVNTRFVATLKNVTRTL